MSGWMTSQLLIAIPTRPLASILSRSAMRKTAYTVEPASGRPYLNGCIPARMRPEEPREKRGLPSVSDGRMLWGARGAGLKGRAATSICLTIMRHYLSEAGCSLSTFLHQVTCSQCLSSCYFHMTFQTMSFKGS